jgi:hypothetical protein
MGDVIRPRFGQERGHESPRDVVAVFQALHVFGDAAGYRVCLVHDPDASEGDVFKVLVGEVNGCDFEPVSLLPATPEGKCKAVTVGLAILRTLELIASIDNGSPV